MLVDGRAIAEDIYRELRETLTARRRVILTVLTCAPNFETQKFLKLKREKAAALGIEVSIVEFDASITTGEILHSLPALTTHTDGLVIQLPFPSSVRIEEVLSSVPPSLDVDAINYQDPKRGIYPPVVGAIDEIARRHEVTFTDTHVVVVGNGRLVGKPATEYAKERGARVTVVTKETANSNEVISSADILILGAGSPHLIGPDMIKDGVVIFDAGTSETSGLLSGDADPRCAEKASLMTPVPGGIGPVTVAVLLRNLVRLSA